jgi:hypothetical protein
MQIQINKENLIFVTISKRDILFFLFIRYTYSESQEKEEKVCRPRKTI